LSGSLSAVALAESEALANPQAPRRRIGLEAAQILLGHSKADVTQLYAERDMSRAATVAAKIG